MPNVLTLTTYTDSHGAKSYQLEGEAIDEEGQPFYVAEFCFDPLKIEASATYYKTSFEGVTIRRAAATN